MCRGAAISVGTGRAIPFHQLTIKKWPRSCCTGLRISPLLALILVVLIWRHIVLISTENGQCRVVVLLHVVSSYLGSWSAATQARTAAAPAAAQAWAYKVIQGSVVMNMDTTSLPRLPRGAGGTERRARAPSTAGVDLQFRVHRLPNRGVPPPSPLGPATT